MKRLVAPCSSSLAVLATTVALLFMVLLISLLTARGLGHFWPRPVWLAELPDGERLYGQRLRTLEDGTTLLQVSSSRATDGAAPLAAVPPTARLTRPAALGRFDGDRTGVVYGQLERIVDDDEPPGVAIDPWQILSLRIARSRELKAEIATLERVQLARINADLERVERELARYADDPARTEPERWLALRTERRRLLYAFEDADDRLERLRRRAEGEQIEVRTADERLVTLPIIDLVAVLRPNELGPAGRLAAWWDGVRRFVSEGPRQAGMAGGVFPALFGTVVLVLLMAALVAPLGMLVAVYLSEYARRNWITRLIRSAIANLAAVPSVVYGVFGLAFFVYTMGGGLDRLLFSDTLPAPTFGTGGLLWASLTLALLTLPVVIVATEEALARVPDALRDASAALGATRFETIRHTVLPVAVPGLLTGLILAMARAAGEVAPLMLVGVVKLARALPLDSEAPYLHLDRKFMHLGFHIYDLALQSPTLAMTESAAYATALLLLLTIVVLNLLAILLRNHLGEQLRRLEGPG